MLFSNEEVQKDFSYVFRENHVTELHDLPNVHRWRTTTEASGVPGAHWHLATILAGIMTVHIRLPHIRRLMVLEKFTLQSVQLFPFFKHPIEMKQASANLFLHFVYLCHVLSVWQMLVCDWHKKEVFLCCLFGG